MDNPTYTIQINQDKIKLSVFFNESPIRQLNLTLDSAADAISVMNNYFFDAVLVSEVSRVGS